MPLASLAWLQWYGPGLGAAVESAHPPTASATLKGLGKIAAVHTTAPTAYARPNNGRQLRAVSSTAPTAYARVSGRGRMAAIGKVNELTQDDVTGAVLESKVEGELTLKETLRVLLAAMRGESTKSSLGAGNVQHVYKSHDGTKARITATVNANGERTSVTVDPT
jgi:hypothetical protein